MTGAALCWGFHFGCLFPVATARYSAVPSQPSLSLFYFSYPSYLFVFSLTNVKSWIKAGTLSVWFASVAPCLEQCLAPGRGITIGMNERTNE